MIGNKGSATTKAPCSASKATWIKGSDGGGNEGTPKPSGLAPWRPQKLSATVNPHVTSPDLSGVVKLVVATVED
jgi:hypothetical protein